MNRFVRSFFDSSLSPWVMLSNFSHTAISLAGTTLLFTLLARLEGPQKAEAKEDSIPGFRGALSALTISPNVFLCLRSRWRLSSVGVM